MDWAGVAWRVVVAGGAAYGATSLVFEADASAPALVGAVLIMLAAGAVTGRAWTALIPPAATVAMIVFVALNPPESEHHEGGWMLGVAIVMLCALAASLCLLLGAGLRQALSSRSRESSPA